MGRVDWLKGTPEQRARLYHVAKAIMDLNNMKPAEFYHMTLSGQNLDPASTHANFSRGILGRRHVASIFRWIEENHLDLALKLAPDLFNRPTHGSWLKLMRERATHGRLELIRLTSFGLVRSAASYPIDDKPVRLGEQFAFRLQVDFDGYVVAFQEVGGLWHLFAVGECEAGSYLHPCPSGPHMLPREPDGALCPLVETETDGLHSFVFLSVQNTAFIEDELAKLWALALKPEQLSPLADTLVQEQGARFALDRMNILFVR